MEPHQPELAVKGQGRFLTKSDLCKERCKLRALGTVRSTERLKLPRTHLLALLLRAHVLDCGAVFLGSELICLAADLVHTGRSLPHRPHVATCRTQGMWLPYTRSNLGQPVCINTWAVRIASSGSTCCSSLFVLGVSSRSTSQGCLDSAPAQTDAEASAALPTCTARQLWDL